MSNYKKEWRQEKQFLPPHIVCWLFLMIRSYFLSYKYVSIFVLALLLKLLHQFLLEVSWHKFV